MPSPNSPVLQQLDGLDESSPDFHDNRDAFQKCLRKLRNICGNNGMLPASYTISSDLLEISPKLIGRGSFGEVYRGTLNGSEVVCIKRMRITGLSGPYEATKAFCKEAVTWAYLEHENILPLLGAAISPIQLISKWMAGGHLLAYVRGHPNINRRRLSSGVAMGLEYLHSRNVVHGDLKGQNVLVDDHGNPRIADFGHTIVLRGADSAGSTPDRLGTLQWTAPEVFSGAPYSKDADVFAFAVVMIEIFTEAIPFPGLEDILAALAILNGKRPERPTHPNLTRDLWEMIGKCWDSDPRSRPKISEVLRVLLTPNEPTWGPSLINISSERETTLIAAIFCGHDHVEEVGQLSVDNTRIFVDIVWKVLDSLEPEIRGKCLHYLRGICDRRVLVPRSLEIPLCYNPEENPLHQSACADMWKGQHNGKEVTAKVLRVWFSDSNGDLGGIKRRFCKEVVAWGGLRHPNLLPLLGVTMAAENRFLVVSEWMEGGNINQFLSPNANSDRIGLLRDATTGLIYLHDQDVIHGNLRGTNILVNKDGRACLADFALMRIISDSSDNPANSAAVATARWKSPSPLSPERFELKGRHPTKESDCYALGMTIYEVLSGLTPFFEYPLIIASQKTLDGARPTRPQGAEGAWFTDDIWGMLERCWEPQPSDRATASAILPGLEGSTPSLEPSSDVDGPRGGATNADE